MDVDAEESFVGYWEWSWTACIHAGCKPGLLKTKEKRGLHGEYLSTALKRICQIYCFGWHFLFAVAIYESEMVGCVVANLDFDVEGRVT